jgi:predicted Rossmann fold flavoprotein
MSAPLDVVVVGAGAAGLAAAIFAARLKPGLRVTVVDGAAKVGAKILVSGGGRCNVTHETVEASDFWGGSPNVVRRILSAFPVDRTVAFFREIGVALHVEERGKLFPDSNSARSVLDALLAEARRLEIDLRSAHRITAVARRDDLFHLSGPAGELTARKTVLATGGLSLPKTGSDGLGYRLATSLGIGWPPRWATRSSPRLPGWSRSCSRATSMRGSPASPIRSRSASGSTAESPRFWKGRCSGRTSGSAGRRRWTPRATGSGRGSRGPP